LKTAEELIALVETLFVFIPNLTVDLSLWSRCGSLFNFAYIPSEREYIRIYGEKGIL
jgi:hypothetical protein